MEVLKHIFHSIGSQEIYYHSAPNVRGWGVEIHIQIGHKDGCSSVITKAIEGCLDMV